MGEGELLVIRCVWDVLVSAILFPLLSLLFLFFLRAKQVSLLKHGSPTWKVLDSKSSRKIKAHEGTW